VIPVDGRPRAKMLLASLEYKCPNSKECFEAAYMVSSGSILDSEG
jgi:hypothetical protein